METGSAMKIFMIEDDKELCNFIQFQLEKEGHSVTLCNHGSDSLYYLEEPVFDLIILDRMLPEIDGLTILKTIRKKGIATPVIMVTALSDIMDRIDGLDAGADDYLIKPFAPEELFARIRALARRPQKIEDSPLLSFGDIQVDVRKKNLLCGSNTVELSKKETDLLEFLIKNHGTILTREILLTRVWGADSFVEDGNLDNYIYFLRRRLKNAGSGIKIKTIRSVGYCLLPYSTKQP